MSVRLSRGRRWAALLVCLASAPVPGGNGERLDAPSQRGLSIPGPETTSISFEPTSGRAGGISDGDDWTEPLLR
jgi:hypothetical protein